MRRPHLSQADKLKIVLFWKHLHITFACSERPVYFVWQIVRCTQQQHYYHKHMYTNRDHGSKFNFCNKQFYGQKRMIKWKLNMASNKLRSHLLQYHYIHNSSHSICWYHRFYFYSTRAFWIFHLTFQPLLRGMCWFLAHTAMTDRDLWWIQKNISHSTSQLAIVVVKNSLKVIIVLNKEAKQKHKKTLFLYWLFSCLNDSFELSQQPKFEHKLCVVSALMRLHGWYWFSWDSCCLRPGE